MLVNIQFLRFVAAMLVVAYHTAAYMPHSDSTRHGLLELGTAIGFAGGASYAIYLSHILILALLAELGLFGWIGGLPFGLVTVASGLVMLTILAYSVAHYRMLEWPLHRRFKRWLQVGSG